MRVASRLIGTQSTLFSSVSSCKPSSDQGDVYYSYALGREQLQVKMSMLPRPLLQAPCGNYLSPDIRFLRAIALTHECFGVRALRSPPARSPGTDSSAASPAQHDKCTKDEHVSKARSTKTTTHLFGFLTSTQAYT